MPVTETGKVQTQLAAALLSMAAHAPAASLMPGLLPEYPFARFSAAEKLDPTLHEGSGQEQLSLQPLEHERSTCVSKGRDAFRKCRTPIEWTRFKEVATLSTLVSFCPKVHVLAVVVRGYVQQVEKEEPRRTSEVTSVWNMGCAERLEVAASRQSTTHPQAARVFA